MWTRRIDSYNKRNIAGERVVCGEKQEIDRMWRQEWVREGAQPRHRREHIASFRLYSVGISARRLLGIGTKRSGTFHVVALSIVVLLEGISVGSDA